MVPTSKSSLLAAVIGLCLLTTTVKASKNEPPQVSVANRRVLLLPTTVTPTTTSLPLPLQPPLNVTSTTTSSFAKPATPKLPTQERHQEVSEGDSERVDGQVTGVGTKLGVADSEPSTAYLLTTPSDSNKELNNKNQTNEQLPEAKATMLMEGQPEFIKYNLSDVAFLPTVPSQQAEAASDSAESSVNGHGYIQFQINDELPVEQIKRRERTNRASTVNEVLSSLFPNGFSDIFRFSYPAEETTEEITVSTSSPSPVYQPSSTELPTVTTSTTTTTAKTPKQNETYYSYQTTVTKEYRRELKPGHTEIVVEKIARVPRITSEEFNDGSNHITRDELLRINRAAVDAPVLPSLLLKPDNEQNTNSSDVTQSMPGPIIILNDDSEFDESSGIEDNQIAESQHLGQQLYQRTVLPESRRIESYHSQLGPQQEQQINVHIIHDESMSKAGQQSPNNVQDTQPRKSLQSLELFEVNTEQYFEQEAPSRKFLKTFKPTVSDSVNGPIVKGNFHYETNGPQSQFNAQPSNENDYAGPYLRPAAQLTYQREQQAAQEVSKLHTKVVPSPPPPNQSSPQQQPSGYGQIYGPTPLPEKPTNLVFVTLNAQNEQQQQTQPSQQSQPTQPVSQQQPVGPTPHDYVAEAAAESSQNQIHQVPAPKSNGYTFVEVQKSVNIHNKLITEKDGRLVEQHETIYHPINYQKPQFSPKDYVLSKPIATQNQPQSPKEYVSLSAHPINVAYESEPHESAYSHASVHLGPVNVQQQHYQNQQQQPQNQPQQQQQTLIIEKLVHQPYPLPVEKIVERPVPIIHEVEKPVPQPYPVKEYIEKEGQPVIIEKLVPKPYPLPVEKIVERPVPIIHEVEKPVPQPYPVKEYIEKVVDRPVPVEKVVDRPVNVPYAVPVDHYIDRPYPVKEIVEKHIGIPYAVPEPVAVPVHYEHYIDRPYPVETIVERPVPYPVETIVEKVVEKEVPIEVERIVEKPIEKMVEKFVDRPVAIPIHVPVAIHLPMLPPTGPTLHSGPAQDFGYPPHPNALPPWSHTGPTIAHVPPKVLQNYYARMLKKLLPQMTTFKTTTNAPQPSAAKSHSPKPTRAVSQPATSPFKLSDMRFDLKPPPPPLGSQWLKGARYIYNTLPEDLSAAAASQTTKLIKSYIGPVPAVQQPAASVTNNNSAGSQLSNNDFDEFQRWRNGHSLKRSPDLGRNLHMEYGFKPPLVPSMEIDDKGMPLKPSEQ